ncbi:MAG: hypothetical protein H6738_13285 [Alphaproteobacteria bacterium]|nr:hypothetical protein [Alphaproteobacteria bacterium]MCB9697750.1 hypothetical protein [Alphaproteobacteria bacterium]
MFWMATAHAFTLDPPVLVGEDVAGLAAAGDTVVLSGREARGYTSDLVVQTSGDRGVTFSSDVVVSDLERTLDPWRTLWDVEGYPVALSADAAQRLVAVSAILRDSRVPDHNPYTPVEWGALGVWREDGAGWVRAHVVDAMTDLCSAPGRRCMHLNDVSDLAASDDGDVSWTTYHGWDQYQQRNPGLGNQVLLARTVRGVAVGAPIDLSTTVLADPTGNEFDARVATDATGDEVLATFEAPGALGTSVRVLAVSQDAGATWMSHTVDGSGGDVALARDAGTVLWATGWYGGGGSEIRVRTSVDGGQTFGAPVTVVQPTFAFSYLRLAVSRVGDRQRRPDGAARSTRARPSIPSARTARRSPSRGARAREVGMPSTCSRARTLAPPGPIGRRGSQAARRTSSPSPTTVTRSTCSPPTPPTTRGWCA